MEKSLLPPGFYDVLPPLAETQARVVETLMAHFGGQGYQRVEAPLMEFEETLLSGPGAALTSSTFRTMDPISQRMLGLRTDHTLQIGRIAASRLADAPRPLRLSYAGPVVSAANGFGARQRMQVGVELIGSLEAESDAEVILLAVTGLKALGLTDISIDLLLPTLMPAIAEAAGLDVAARNALHQALDRKDEAAVAALGKGKTYDTALQLLRAGGAPSSAMKALESVSLPEKAAADRERLQKVLALLAKNFPARLTVDFVETRCFEYQTGLSFSVFSKKAEGVLARGGRYRTQSNEPSTGFTFYAETLAPLMPEESRRA